MSTSATRYVVLDTETTGLNPKTGDRIIEIGCIELVDRRLTGRHFHTYLNPEREIDEGATAVHGFRLEDLLDKPKFAQISAELIDFVGDADIIIHNAPFDVAFLDAELGRLDLGPFGQHCNAVFDTLSFAKELHPGKRNSLDALCDRYGISNSHRTLHGALLDAELLAEVYLAMTRGQESLVIDMEPTREAAAAAALDTASLKLVVLRASDEELAAHETLLDALDKEVRGTAVWRAAAATLQSA